MNEIELPKYTCHKKVWALRIKDIEHHDNGSATITPLEDGYAPFAVSCEYMVKHKPNIRGYYVVYKDGYTSFSPADSFEDGYTRDTE
jgi:hypothetical protein